MCVETFGGLLRWYRVWRRRIGRARELRHSFVSVLSDAGIPVEQISQLVGHRGKTVTELVYRYLLRPVLQAGATVMDRLFVHEDGSA